MLTKLSPARRRNAFRGAAFIIAGALLAAVIWSLWLFHPWMKAGQAIYLSNSHFDDFDFQVWQRKNVHWSEPFSTGLFVRTHAGNWRAFLLDFEDDYAPEISLRKESCGIGVFYGRDRWGCFDEKTQELNREREGQRFAVEPMPTEGDPPGDWLRETKSQ